MHWFPSWLSPFFMPCICVCLFVTLWLVFFVILCISVSEPFCLLASLSMRMLLCGPSQTRRVQPTSLPSIFDSRPQSLCLYLCSFFLCVPLSQCYSASGSMPLSLYLWVPFPVCCIFEHPICFGVFKPLPLPVLSAVDETPSPLKDSHWVTPSVTWRHLAWRLRPPSDPSGTHVCQMPAAPSLPQMIISLFIVHSQMTPPLPFFTKGRITLIHLHLK